jgi:K(+)-stimulated pyrophosphate-energized sodium pump
MKIATKTNVRTTKPHVRVCPSLKVSFGGTVMGLGVAGLAVLGLTTIFFFHFMNGV